MKTLFFLFITFFFGSLFFSCQYQEKKAIGLDRLRDKIAGGWAGKMIGVSYGGPTEFDAHGSIYTDSIRWKPSDISFALTEDDIYVQLTFMMAMDQYGVDAPAKKLQELFAKSGYKLWHANVQARKNYFDSIFPPQSGSPEYNAHADDIDFQIEADYIGLMCPGLPRTASRMAEKTGHIMNYGDGMFGGVFLASMYAAAFFEDKPVAVVEKALLSLPEQSDYARIIRDVLTLHRHYPSDWKKSWQELENKWAATDICGSGSPYNIDAKFNGAYIVMGLLYGEGDPVKTLEIATRCGQDSDCNPSNAMGVLGVIKGFSGLPEPYRKEVEAVADSMFINTSYSFRKAVDNTIQYALKQVITQGGILEKDSLWVPVEKPRAMAQERSFPNYMFDRRVPVASKEGWTFTGSWDSTVNDQKIVKARKSSKAGDVMSYTFEGSALFLSGNWNTDGGKADVFIDGKLQRTIDTYFDYSDQHPGNTNIFVCPNLTEGKHILRLVVLGKKRPESKGTNIAITEAIVFKKGKNSSDNYRFPFE